MNFGELKTALKRYGFDDTDPLGTWINAAMHDVETYYSWPWMVDSLDQPINLTNISTITIPSNFHSVKYAQVTSPPQSDNLRFLPSSEFEKLDPARSGTYPSYYTSLLGGMGNGIRFWPKSNGAAFTVRLVFSRGSDDLVGDSDVPTFLPNTLHYAIVYRAASIALKAENEEDRAVSAYDDYTNLLDQNIAQYGGAQTSRGYQVIDEQGYGE